MVGAAFTWATLYVNGIAWDICGAVVLAWSFSAKKPWEIRQQIPRTIQIPTLVGSSTLEMPEGLVRSIVRQRSEARLGVFLLVTGFVIQALYYFFPHAGNLDDWPKRLVTLALLAIPVGAALVGMRTYVPRDEKRTWNQIECEEARLQTTARKIVEAHIREKQ
jgi:hypothetical protein